MKKKKNILKRAKMKVKVSVSKTEDRQTTFGFLSNGVAAKNDDWSVKEIKKLKVCSLISC